MTHAVVAILVVSFVVATLLAYRHQCLLRDRARLMHDAIRHRDFTFRLPTKGLLFGERALQEVLNDMGQDIQRLVAQGEVESWQRLTRVLTHEIMNATTPIRSISQAYLSDPSIKGSAYEEGIRAIRDTSMGLAVFVDSYRKLTQLQEPIMKDINLSGFLASLPAIHPHIRWEIDVPSDTIIHADESLLRQVFINIARNASEANAHTIGIRHVPRQQDSRRPPHAFCKLQVSNDGHSIPDDVACDVFVPFFTTKPQGSGIGLSLSRRILMMQGFSLSLREHPITGYNVTFEIEDDRL